MDNRLDLHEQLCEILGSRNVYFQPPESLKLLYPCIVYSLSGMLKLNANNRLYKSRDSYQVIVVDANPDTDIHDLILDQFPMCRFDRSYVSDNLNHYVLTLYY